MLKYRKTGATLRAATVDEYGMADPEQAMQSDEDEYSSGSVASPTPISRNKAIKQTAVPSTKANDVIINAKSRMNQEQNGTNSSDSEASLADKESQKIEDTADASVEFSENGANWSFNNDEKAFRFSSDERDATSDAKVNEKVSTTASTALVTTERRSANRKMKDVYKKKAKNTVKINGEKDENNQPEQRNEDIIEVGEDNAKAPTGSRSAEVRDANDGSVRKSKRQRIQPLEYWRNERIRYVLAKEGKIYAL